MKIRTTVREIECTADELRQSNSAADAFMNIFRNAMNGAAPRHFEDDSDEDEENE